MSQGEKNVQPDRGSNPGPPAYKASALPTELPGPLTHLLTNCIGIGTVTYSPAKLEFVPELSGHREQGEHDLDEPTGWVMSTYAVTAPRWEPNVTG